jgi:hypothetical protein
MFHSKALKLSRHQRGTVAIEFVVHVSIIAFMMGMLLQVGRTFILYNVTLSAVYSATMHVATMPEAELLNPLLAKPSASLIVEKMRQAGAIDISDHSYTPVFSCTPNPSAPCIGSTKPTQVHVRITHLARDTIFQNFTTDVDHQIHELMITYRARIPRVGFVKL